MSSPPCIFRVSPPANREFQRLKSAVASIPCVPRLAERRLEPFLGARRKFQLVSGFDAGTFAVHQVVLANDAACGQLRPRHFPALDNLESPLPEKSQQLFVELHRSERQAQMVHGFGENNSLVYLPFHKHTSLRVEAILPRFGASGKTEGEII